jgi:parallel beta-helix repeat protein
VGSNRFEGIELDSSCCYNVIDDNTASNNGDGISLSSCESNYIRNNTANSNDYNGIRLEDATHNIISSNTACLNRRDGIKLGNSSYNTIQGNILRLNGDYGIEVYESNYTIIRNNTASISERGIALGGNMEVDPEKYRYLFGGTGSHNNLLENNVVFNNTYGIALTLSCNNTIKNNIASNNIDGINLGCSKNNSIKNNVAINNQGGIDIAFLSENNTIDNNIASHNYGIGQSGIRISSEKNTIKNNIINSNYGLGITVGAGFFNIIENNNISLNKYGGIIFTLSSSGNFLYHNNIINNTPQIRMTYVSEKNYWYHPYLLEGNYWSDYNGTDINGDGIGDTGISHPGYPCVDIDYDNYPYMNKSGWLTFLVSPEYWDFGTVYQGEIVQKSFEMQNAFVYNNSRDDLNILSVTSEPEVSISGVKLSIKIPKGYSKKFNATIDTTNLEGHILRSLEIQSDDKITPNKTILIYGFVKPPIHDVRIKNIDFQSRLIKGQINLFNITLENRGDFREKNVSIEFRGGNKSLGNATITNIESKETKSAIFKWDTSAVAPKTYDVLIEVKLKHQRLVDSLHVSVKILPVFPFM